MKSSAVSGGGPVRREMLPLAKPFVGQEELQGCAEVLASGYLSRGPLVKEFEEEFAKYVGAKYAVSVSSGTAALHLAARALDLPPDAEVIVPSLTFVATALSALYVGLKPVFAEVNRESFNIDPADIERKINSHTKAIIPVHYGGQPADMLKIREMAQRYRLFVIEDACHAIGATLSGKKVGSFGNLGVFSLFATKNITGGEGGVVVTDNEVLASEVRRLRAHSIVHDGELGVSGEYDVTDIGYNYHLGHLNIAVAMAQLKRLDQMNEMRQENARYLTHLLEDIEGVIPPRVGEGFTHVFHLYTVLLRLDKLRASRQEIIQAMMAQGIQVGIYYRPVHLFTLFRDKFGCREGDLPVTEELCSRLLTLPMYPQLTKKDIQDIAEALKKTLKTFSKKA